MFLQKYTSLMLSAYFIANSIGDEEVCYPDKANECIKEGFDSTNSNDIYINQYIIYLAIIIFAVGLLILGKRLYDFRQKQQKAEEKKKEAERKKKEKEAEAVNTREKHLKRIESDKKYILEYRNHLVSALYEGLNTYFENNRERLQFIDAIEKLEKILLFLIGSNQLKLSRSQADSNKNMLIKRIKKIKTVDDFLLKPCTYRGFEDYNKLNSDIMLYDGAYVCYFILINNLDVFFSNIRNNVSYSCYSLPYADWVNGELFSEESARYNRGSLVESYAGNRKYPMQLHRLTQVLSIFIVVDFCCCIPARAIPLSVLKNICVQNSGPNEIFEDLDIYDAGIQDVNLNKKIYILQLEFLYSLLLSIGLINLKLNQDLIIEPGFAAYRHNLLIEDAPHRMFVCLSWLVRIIKSEVESIADENIQDYVDLCIHIKASLEKIESKAENYDPRIKSDLQQVLINLSEKYSSIHEDNSTAIVPYDEDIHISYSGLDIFSSGVAAGNGAYATACPS